MTPENRALVEQLSSGLARTLELHGETYFRDEQIEALLNAAREQGRTADAAARIAELAAALRPFANLGASLPEHFEPGAIRHQYEIDPKHIWAARTAIYGDA